MKNPISSRRGFTLIELAAAVVILAILVAAVLPVVVRQIEDAEPTRVANDMSRFATGIEMFSLNVRPAFPSNLFQLTSPITSSSPIAAVNDPGTFSVRQVNAWKGPYVNVTFQNATSTIRTGFGGTLHSQLYWFDSSAGENESGAEADGARDGEDFLAIRVTGLTADEFAIINSIIDGAGFTSTTGRVRFLADDPNQIHFLAVPVRPGN